MSSCLNDSLPDPQSIGIARDVPAGLAPNLPLTREAMRKCCSPNEIQFSDYNCVVWCELSEDFMTEVEQAPGNVAHHLMSCLKRMDPNVTDEISITTGQSASVSSPKPPTLATLGLTMLLVLWTLNFLM